jgi:type II secretory pathway pseudopilin PulG
MKHSARVRGYSLLEVLVSLAVLLTGVVMIIYFFPQFLRAASDAEFKSRAAMLAQLKSEEIRRDDSTTRTLITQIQNLTTPTPYIEFTQEPRLSYAFSGQSEVFDLSQTPQGDVGVARVIIKYSSSYRNSNPPTKDILYELRFGP